MWKNSNTYKLLVDVFIYITTTEIDFALFSKSEGANTIWPSNSIPSEIVRVFTAARFGRANP